MILLGAVVATVLLVWVHFLLFHFVDTRLIPSAANAPNELGIAGGALSLAEARAALAAIGTPLAGLLCFVLYPLQYELIRDLIAVGGVLGFISLVAVFSIWWERKVASHIQSRTGPMRVGGWHGWAQSPADGLKLLCKEDFCPGSADEPLFRLAPYLAFVPAVLAFLCLPFGAYWIFRELDVGDRKSVV